MDLFDGTEPEAELEPVIVRPVVHLTPRNLKALLSILSLTPGGIYLASYLYDEYVILCGDVEGQPISKKAFGMSLAFQGCIPTTKRQDGKQHRAYLIPRSRFLDTIDREPCPEFSPDSRHPTIEHPDGT